MVKNADVKHLQQFLTNETLYTAPITGNFYTATQKAVKDFQKREQLTITGKLDDVTRERINEILNQQETLLNTPSDGASYNNSLAPITPQYQTTNPVQSSVDGLSNNNYYTNSDGVRVHSPAYEKQKNTIPYGASAQCADGTYSFSQSRRGTCSHHGGVAEWF
jgi:peptidoglycan hydrolase-like protein with peptidoglycan-binding domain